MNSGHNLAHRHLIPNFVLGLLNWCTITTYITYLTPRYITDNYAYHIKS